MMNCEGCGEEKQTNVNHLCKECQVMKCNGDFEMPPLTRIRR